MGITYGDIKRKKNKVYSKNFQDKTIIRNNIKTGVKTLSNSPNKTEDNGIIKEKPHSKDDKELETEKIIEEKPIKTYSQYFNNERYVSIGNLIKIEKRNNISEKNKPEDSNILEKNFSLKPINGEIKNNLITIEKDNEELLNNCFDEEEEKENQEVKDDKNKEKNEINRMLTNNIIKVFIDSKIQGKEKKENDFNFEQNDENSTNLGSRTSSSFSTFDYELNFYKNGNEIRESYISKLISMNIWNPSLKPRQHNSIIIFDWDDTLFPTTFMTPEGVFDEDIKLSEKEKQKLVLIEKYVFSLLTQALQKGKVYIITNAGYGWVEYSSKRFFPSIVELFSKIEIISAREKYEDKYPGNSRLWKIQAFLTLLKNVNVELVTNIICLGDSLYEIEAGRILASKFSNAFIKTIKFKEDPKLDELIKQLSLVSHQFNLICSRIKNLTIRLEKKKREL